MPARRNTPFEVMGKAPAPGDPERQEWTETGNPVSEAPQKPTPQPDPTHIPDDPPELLAPGQPLVLRIPKGLAAGALVLLLLILVLAYWVGYQRGFAAADNPGSTNTPSPPGPMSTTEPLPFVGADLQSPGVQLIDLQTTPLGPHQPKSTADPRIDGLNYLILATYPRQDALELAAFLADRGVATILDPVNNARFQIVAVNAGFSRDAYEQGIHETYRRTMMEIGRAWHAHNGSRGNDALQDMYFYRHGP